MRALSVIPDETNTFLRLRSTFVSQTAFSKFSKLGFCMWGSDLDETGQAEVDAASFLWDFHVADGDVGHDRQHQGLERLVETVGEALGPRHLKR